MNVLQILMFAAIVLEVIFVPIFLKNEWPNRSYRSLAYKQLCSALFLVVGLCAIFHAKKLLCLFLAGAWRSGWLLYWGCAAAL